MTTTTNYVSSHAIAKLIGASPSAVLNWIDGGLLPCYRTPGGHRRVRTGALIQFLRENEMPVPRSLVGVSRLLVVDDDKGVLRSVKRLIKKRVPALTVETSEGAMDALLKIGIFRPDAVLVDAYMPGMNGVELCEKLRSNTETEHMTVVALSGKVTRKLEEQLLTAGAVAVLGKPLDSQKLLGALGLQTAASFGQ